MIRPEPMPGSIKALLVVLVMAGLLIGALIAVPLTPNSKARCDAAKVRANAFMACNVSAVRGLSLCTTTPADIAQYWADSAVLESCPAEPPEKPESGPATAS